MMADKHWYDTAEWKEAEAEADADLAAGRFDDFESIDALIADLEALTEIAACDQNSNETRAD